MTLAVSREYGANGGSVQGRARPRESGAGRANEERRDRDQRLRFRASWITESVVVMIRLFAW